MKNTIIAVLSICAIALVPACTKTGLEQAIKKELRKKETSDSSKTKTKTDTRVNYCDSLKHVLSTQRAGSDAYNKTMDLLRLKCGSKSETNLCDSLKRQAARLDKNSREYQKLMEEINASCGQKDHKYSSYCDSLKKVVTRYKEGSEEYNRTWRLIKTKCPDTKKDPVDCDALARKLKALDSTSADYARLLEYYKKNCGKYKK
ncbi:hypothetical protein GC194_00130 [bacterium]|nr:hypothetical protein [bacterium]